MRNLGSVSTTAGRRILKDFRLDGEYPGCTASGVYSPKSDDIPLDYRSQGYHEVPDNISSQFSYYSCSRRMNMSVRTPLFRLPLITCITIKKGVTNTRNPRTVREDLHLRPHNPPEACSRHYHADNTLFSCLKLTPECPKMPPHNSLLTFFHDIFLLSCIKSFRQSHSSIFFYTMLSYAPFSVP